MSDLFSKNYFEIFDIKPGFQIDLAGLADKYRLLQKQAHPDRFASAGEQQGRLALQMASLINQAYETLKQDVPRAQYLLKLAGLDIDHDQDTTMDPVFLMEQMELREEIENVAAKSDPLTAVDALVAQVKQQQKSVADAFANAYEKQDISAAHELARKLQFLQKNLRELDDVAAKLEDELFG